MQEWRCFWTRPGGQTFTPGKRVSYRTTTQGERVDFGTLMEGVTPVFVRARSAFKRRTPFCESRAASSHFPSHFTMQPEFRKRPFAESPEVQRKIQEAFARADVSGAQALVVYDPLLLNGRLETRLNAAPYALAVIGKTEQDVQRACAAVSLVHKDVMRYDDHDLDREVFLLSSPHRVTVISGDGLPAAIFTTVYNPSSHLDDLLRNGGRGKIATIAVAGLCRVLGDMAVIEAEVLRHCVACARFDEIQ